MLLAAEQDLAVIGDTAGVKSEMDQVRSLQPDVVLVDLDMLSLDGISTVKTIRSICPQAAIILLSMYDDLLDCEQASNAGAVVFVAKSLPADTLLATIRQVAHVD